jgi:Cell wall-active antibiotics response 4TMS YvqF
MRRDIGTVIVGLIFLAAGIAVGGSILGYFDFQINLAGWWTLFLIVPALIAIAQGGINAGNVVILAVGVILLLKSQGALPEGFTWKLIFPIVLLAIGAQLVFGNFFFSSGSRGRRCDEERSDASGADERAKARGEGQRGDSSRPNGGIFTETSRSGASYKTASVFFGGQDIIYSNEDFSGASYTAIFGGLTINMRNVRLQGDVVINVTSAFGGIDIIMPDNVLVISHVVPVLGGVDLKYASSKDPNAYRVIVNGNTAFGGVTLK